MRADAWQGRGHLAGMGQVWGGLDDRRGFRTPSPRQWGPWRVLTCLPEGGAEGRRQEATGLWEHGVAGGWSRVMGTQKGNRWGGRSGEPGTSRHSRAGGTGRAGGQSPASCLVRNLISLEASL